MTERPILFQGAMVRAILNGTKTQTRRIVKPRKDRDMGCLLAPHEIAGEVNAGRYRNSPYGAPGDRLWVREAIRLVPDQKPDDGTGPVLSIYDHAALDLQRGGGGAARAGARAMTDPVYIPTACLADARRVLSAQNPETSQLAQKWPAAQWRAAIRQAAQEIEDECSNDA